MLILKKKVVNKLKFMLRSARGIVWKARHLWMRTRKHSYKKAWVCGEIYCIMHNHTGNILLLGTVLQSFLLKKIKLSWHMQNIITNTFGLQWYTGTQTKRTGMDEKWECQFSCWNQITAKQVKIFSMDFFYSFLRAQYQRGIMEILEPTS